MHTRIFRVTGLLTLALGTQYATAAHYNADSATHLLELSLAELINTPVVTASRSTESRDQTPAHIVVISREQIRERRYKNLADLLEDMPGVDFQRGTKSSQFNQFTVQGNLGPNRLLVLLDGIRISQPSAGSYPLAENLALYQAKQVEFLYGPAAALYGADAVSGVVNIITEAGNQTDGSWFSVGGGSFNSREYSFMSGFSGANNISLSVGAHWQESNRARLDKNYKSDFRKVDTSTDITPGEPFISAGNRERYRGEINSHSLFARLDWKEQLTLGYYRHHFTSLTSTGDPYATARYTDKARWMTTSDTLYGRYNYSPTERLDAQLQLDYSRMEVDPRSNYNNRYNGFEAGYSYSLGRRISVEKNFDWHWTDRQHLQFGLGAQHFKAIEGGSMPSRYRTGKSPGQQGMFYPNTDDNLPMQIADDRSESYYGYTQLQSEWSDTFSTVAGFRFDHHTVYGDSFNPRLGLVWKPHAQHLFKLMYGEAFRAPSADEGLGGYGTFSGNKEDGLYEGNGFRVANPDLKPEKSRTLALVWEWRPTHSLNLITNLYHSRISDLIVTSERREDNTAAIPGAVLKRASQKINAGRQHQTGLDLSAQWRFRVSDSWAGDLWASAGWIHGRVEEKGVDLKIPYVAKYRFKAGTTFRYQDMVTITPKLRWTGSVTNGRTKPPEQDSNLPSASCNSNKKAPQRCATAGYAVLDTHLGWHDIWGSPASFWLDVYNLTDKRYYAAGGAAGYTFWDMPQQPRTWVMSLEWQF